LINTFKKMSGLVVEASVDNKAIYVAVGSLNPVKTRAAVRGIASALKVDGSTIRSQGFDTESQVPDQPFGDQQTKLGAINRAKSAYEGFHKSNGYYPSYAVGLEGGCALLPTEPDVVAGGGLECFAWMAVYNGDKLGVGRSASFILPKAISDIMLTEGVELGVADDRVFKTMNAKQGDGTVGHLTNNVIDRCLYYEMAVVLAMIPFLNPDLY
jgi:inosine/xanthosine triphosphatase